MVKYIGRRIAYAIPTILAVATVAFFLIHLVPGDPGRAVLGPRASTEAVDALNRQMGLDQPLLTQYWQFMQDVVRLDFGQSIQYKVAVSSLIGPRIVPTALLIAFGLLIGVLIAIPSAVISAVHQDRLADHAFRIVGLITFVMPPFWLGLLLALVFGLQLDVLPTSGYDSSTPVTALRSLTLPAMTLGLGISSLVLRTQRAAIIEALSSEYVEAARARGFSERRVLYRYALRNSLTASLTVTGLIIVAMIGFSVVIENVFSIPGMGSLLVSAVASRDFPVITCLMVLMGTAIVLVNLAVDIGYGVADPRVRL